MRIAPMRLSDYDDVVALWKRTKGVDVGPSDSKPNIRKYLQRNPGLSQVARHNGALVGAVLCGHDGRRGFIVHLAVDESARGQGIGKSLVDKALAGLTKAGITRCYIFVYVNNVSGRRFWKRTGWKTHRTFTFMSKDLPAKKSKGCNC